MHSSIWKISPHQFPLSGQIEDKIQFFLKYAILAPSAHNTQPWRCEITKNTLDIFRDPEHTLAVGDPTLRETTIGIGTFIENFVIAAEYFGYICEISNEAFRTSELLQARLTLREGKESKDPTLFNAITKRHTNRGLYHSDPLPQSVLKSFSFEDSGIGTFIITDQESKNRIGQLVSRGVKIALSMRPMKEELAELVSLSEENRNTGMTVEAMSENAVNVKDGKSWVLNEMDVKADAESGRERFSTAPVLIVIGTEFDGPLAWLRTGRLLERILLRASSHGLNHDISAAPVEVPTLAPLLRKEIDISYRPQALIRIGVPINDDFTKNSSRRMI